MKKRPVSIQLHPTPARGGFSLIEMLTGLVIVSILVAAAMPRARNALIAGNIRSARQTVSAAATTARAAAVARGCRTTLHLPNSGAIWVTGCRRFGPGIDTLGPVDSISKRFSVSLNSTTDSIVFTPRGLRADVQATVIRFTKSTYSGMDSVVISPIGRVAY
jgi:prepilin-type N-terminal cleavage/methylation domain-containing protein